MRVYKVIIISWANKHNTLVNYRPWYESPYNHNKGSCTSWSSTINHVAAYLLRPQITWIIQNTIFKTISSQFSWVPGKGIWYYVKMCLPLLFWSISMDGFSSRKKVQISIFWGKYCKNRQFGKIGWFSKKNVYWWIEVEPKIWELKVKILLKFDICRHIHVRF